MSSNAIRLDVNLAVSHDPEVKHLLHISKLQEFQPLISKYHDEITPR